MGAESLRWNIKEENLCVWSWNLENGTIGLTENWHRFLGFDHSGESNSAWFNSLLHPDDLPRVLNFLEHHLSGQTSAAPFCFRLKHKNNGYLYFESRGAVVLRDPAGLPGHVIWACEKINQVEQ